ncbi:hypothetical protein [Fibrella aquatilis]|uniref:Uncharacterized protein n=1 Tax=Fibrella aquatilis TaxID=2817059 RepID=A0A939JZI6_9BACT|nr:hypothetical protein [Fibrella aquatilis]MBO0930220.1 hypothetical protein [Fibrella aquatilis]
MKQTLLGLALLATLATAAQAGDTRKSKKVKVKAKTENCEKQCEKGSGGTGCCAKRAQV